MSDPTVLQYLKSIENTVNKIDARLDGHAVEISSLKEFRSEMHGKATMATAISSALAGVVAWLVTLYKTSQ